MLSISLIILNGFTILEPIKMLENKNNKTAANGANPTAPTVNAESVNKYGL